VLPERLTFCRPTTRSPPTGKGDWQANHLRHINRDAANTRLIARLNVGQVYVYAYISEGRRPVSTVAA
jgi:hypothetical protein